MKNLLALPFFLFFTWHTQAQTSELDAFREKYGDNEDAKVVTVKGNVFQLFSEIASNLEDEEGEVLQRLAENINGVEVMSIPMYKSGLMPEEIKGLRNDLTRNDFEEYVTMRDGDRKVNVMAQGKAKEVKNMVVLVEEENEFVLMNVNGTISMKDVAALKNYRNKD